MDIVERLQKARCWHESDGFGYRATKWINLRSRDVDDAVAEIERLRAALSDIEEARFWKFPNEQAKNAHNSVTPDEMRKHLWEWSRSRARAALSGKTEDERNRADQA